METNKDMKKLPVFLSKRYFAKERDVICFTLVLIPCGKFGPPYLANAVATARAALSRHISACMLIESFRVFVIHRTLTWSCMIVNVHM